MSGLSTCAHNFDLDLTLKQIVQVLEDLAGDDIFDPLAAYTQRHFARIDRLLDSSCILDYVLSAMNVVQPSPVDQMPEAIT